MSFGVPGGIIAIASMVAALAGTTGESPAQQTCERPGSITVIETSEARVYRRGPRDGNLIGCIRADGKLRYLNSRTPGVETRVDFPPPAMDLVDTLLLEVWRFEDEDQGGGSYQLLVGDLRCSTGSACPPRAVIRGPYFVGGVGSAQLKENGSFAYISCPKPPGFGKLHRPCTDPRDQTSIHKVYAYPDIDNGRRRLLARGRSIDPSSLQLKGDQLTWNDNGRRRSALLP